MGPHYVSFSSLGETIQKRSLLSTLRTEKTSFIFSFQIEWDMIVVTVFLSILNKMEFHMVQNRKENCHHDRIQISVKGNGNLVFSVCSGVRNGGGEHMLFDYNEIKMARKRENVMYRRKIW